MVTIFGAKGRIQNIEMFLKNIQNLSDKYDKIIQALDADLIYGKNHLISSIKHAKRAFEEKSNSTNSLLMEILLYASGERQIKKAIYKMGVKKGNVNIAFFIEDKNVTENKQKISEEFIDKILKLLDLNRDDKVLEGDVNTLLKFGITKDELRTISESKYGDIILEKVALVDIIK